MTAEASISTVPPLRGSRCRQCGNVAFPVAAGCQRCGSADVQPRDLSRRGTVWAHTIQRFAPKSPPYVPPAEGFAPFAVGYVELPDGVRVEAVLECSTFSELDSTEVSLVAVEPVPRFATDGWLGNHTQEVSQ